MTDPGRILIVKLSAIGDCLHATPALEALRTTYPSHHIGWAVHLHCAPVVTGNPFVSQIHRYDRKQFWKSLGILTKSIRKARYDTVLDQQGLFKSGLVTRLSGAKRRFGPQEAREQAGVFYTDKLPDQRGNHIVDCYLNRAAAIGARWEQTPRMYFPTDHRDAAYAQMLWDECDIDEGQPVVVLNPSAGKPFKQWAPERFARLAEALVQEHGAKCLITGSRGDRPLADGILHALHDKGIVHDMIGRTSLSQLAALFRRVDLFVGGDTGPMHMAQAMGCPVLALFGPTNPQVLGPREPIHRTIYHPATREQGMTQITVEEVVAECATMLSR